MTGIILYIIFALATAITAVYELFYPSFVAAESINPNSLFMNNKWVAHATLFLLAATLAPIYFFICIIPSLAERYKFSLLKEIVK